MTLPAEQQKQQTVDRLAALAARGLGGAQAELAAQFVRQFYDHVAPEDVLGRSAEDLVAAALSLWRFAEVRQRGRAKLRVFASATEHDAASAPRTVIEIVNDDMPFLVDSVTAALAGQGLTPDLVIHPILRVERDGNGRLASLSGNGGGGNGADLRESVMHIEASGARDPARLAFVARTLEAVLEEVRAAVGDWAKMRQAVRDIARELASRPPPLPQADIKEGIDFLSWLEDDNFTFLGFREYRFGMARDEALDIVPGSGLGILRDDAYTVFDGLRRFAALPPDVRQFLKEPRLLLITKANRRARVHRVVPMDAICVKSFDNDGNVLGERLVVGLFTSLAYSRSPRAVPLLRRKVERTLARAGFDPTSHDGKALLHVLETYPRDELFQIAEDELFDTALGIVRLQERQRIALFVRRDPFERFVSCLVYVPRERYDTALRRRFAQILEEAFAGAVDSFNTQLDDSLLGRVRFLVRTTPGAVPAVDIAALERRLAEAGRSWAERLDAALIAADASTAPILSARYGEAFSTAYRERFSAAAAVEDIRRLEELRAGAAIAVMLEPPADASSAELRFRIYRAAAPVPLSDVLPVLEDFGLKAVTERPYAVTPAEGDRFWMQDISLLAAVATKVEAGDRARFEQAFERVWSGAAESDGLNRLVLAAGLDWRQVMVLRLYTKLLRQAGATYSQAYMEDALAGHPPIARNLAALFERRFDPAKEKNRAADEAKLATAVTRDLDAVASLDEDRILRSYLLLITKSLRTNYFQRDRAVAPKPYLSVKLSSRDIELLALPRPLYEIYVLSPRVEGVHLRGGRVARGGIRWSDRKEDFRTEILGLMKAQMVKNAVIVPTGSKGGFVVKRPPEARDALQTEGIECYKILLRGLLDLTDNIVEGRVVSPSDVVRHDGDDPYLVVAADKGTATFSDIANGVSAEYGFWLGDAFASGGSAGYDHKAMGITARGAWETVKRHFRERGIDIQTTDFTVIGVGDMSGDVFGNGMLRSPHIKLIAAFDHRHIFLDPTPDPARSFAERQRLFALPRSSWADYDKAAISPGGGVFPRSAKSIALSPEIRAKLGTDAEKLSPPELIRTLLTAAVDLLWFGGIGTYVKASGERNVDVGDRANDALRVDAEALRCAVIGEGANLAVTQRGRVAFALKGGRINTDAIDNSAGVDTSDHEVNIKILLGAVVASGGMTIAERNSLLHQMTEAVAQLVLADNYLQSLALTLAEAQGVARLDEQARFMRGLERLGELSRAVEFLPNDQELAARFAAGRGLTRPELAVLMAYAKNTLVDALLASVVPDDPALLPVLHTYFPPVLVARFAEDILAHRLRREIIATGLANDLVNRGGITCVSEMRERTGRGADDIARAYVIAKQVFDLDALWHCIDALDVRVPASVQTEMLLTARRLLERAVAWFLRAGALDIAAQTAAFRPRIAALAEEIAAILPAAERAELERRRQRLVDQGVPPDVAFAAARLDFLTSSVDIVRLSLGSPGAITEIARHFYTVGERFRLDALRFIARSLKIESTWQKQAIDALIEDFYAQQAALTAQALGGGVDTERWLQSRAGAISHIEGLVRDIEAAPAADLAMLTVAARALRSAAAF